MAATIPSIELTSSNYPCQRCGKSSGTMYSANGRILCVRCDINRIAASNRTMAILLSLGYVLAASLVLAISLY